MAASSAVGNPTRKSLDLRMWEKVLELNVGGVTYCTSLRTMLAREDSYFHARFRHLLLQEHKEEPSTYFIDRDGLLFRYVLNYLRMGKVVFGEEPIGIVRQLREEAEFFSLTEMVELIDKQLFVLETEEMEKLRERRVIGEIYNRILSNKGISVDDLLKVAKQLSEVKREPPRPPPPPPEPLFSLDETF